MVAICILFEMLLVAFFDEVIDNILLIKTPIS
nr:MAG TPA: hypothetical protein [Caudoviricetes sp.]